MGKNHNLSTSILVEKILENKEGILSNTGAVVCQTGKFTGRSPKDKFFVKNLKESSKEILWHKSNQYISQKNFENLLDDMNSFMQNCEIYSRNMYAGSDNKTKVSLSIYTSLAWHNLFCKNLFIESEENLFKKKDDHYTIICLPNFFANPEKYGVLNKNFTVINFHDKYILIGGSAYAGEIKKSVFTIFNYLMPTQYNYLPMHCSATVGKEKNDTAIFFGLSGTGKTTLSADPNRLLVGDDEHVWTNENVFNIEGGCYAKTINLSKEKEPHIYNAIKFGAVLENIPLDNDERIPDFTDNSITENTRVAYNLSSVSNKVSSGIAKKSPENIFFLTCDAYGVLPPVSQLNLEQTEKYFLLGYTAKIAGTELGIKEPQPTFSSCFGEAFLPLDPKIYSKKLIEKIINNNSKVWLINTGWVGGSYGVGKRIDIQITRDIIDWILELEEYKTQKNIFIKEKYFDLNIPNVKNKSFSEFLFPEKIWDNILDYEIAAAKLKNIFEEKLNEIFK